ncbi:hypothetical protein [Comamonas sp.]|uniref:hypothetical protein n=1 Tax=Comamonas sp. TaxID=34028 RepID=UPI003A8E576A
MPQNSQPTVTPAERKNPLRWAAAMFASITALITGCQIVPGSMGPGPGPSQGPAPFSSSATTPKAYRQDAAKHVYVRNADRIYKGMLPPMLYAVGVLQVSVDGQGRVTKLQWMRAPSHAPEVVSEIERTVRSAAPFPAPARMGQVVYTDTWLWDKSGRFQLDTLTEGQREQ